MLLGVVGVCPLCTHAVRAALVEFAPPQRTAPRMMYVPGLSMGLLVFCGSAVVGWVCWLCGAGWLFVGVGLRD